MPCARQYPTDSQLLEKSLEHLVKLATEHQISLRQNYNREAPRLAAQVGRYAHARQFKRMHKAVRTLKTRVGRIQLEIERKFYHIHEAHQAKARPAQPNKQHSHSEDKEENKLYAQHAPEVECISKGKARSPYEFGVKVSSPPPSRKGSSMVCTVCRGTPWQKPSNRSAFRPTAIKKSRSSTRSTCE